MENYEEFIKIDKNTNIKIDYWLNYNTDSSERLNEDETFVKTVKFEDGLEMDIKCCGTQEGVALAEAVLFDNGKECCFTDVYDEFLEDWELAWKGNVYTVHVIPEKIDVLSYQVWKNF
jgi:hypothetical protein